MNNKSSITALMSSFGRAFHTENEEHPVFEDHLAKKLMTAEEYAAVQGYILDGVQFFEPELDPTKQEPTELLRRIVNVHIAPSPLCRAAYTEQSLKAATLTGTKQYVMLGASMDTFAFREKEFLAKHRVFEVDHPLTQTDKRERITRTGWTVPDNLAFVPVDFTKDNLTECLITAGFDPSVKSFFSWLGVTYYLSAEAIDTMLTALSRLCADGSTIVFDYPDEDFFDAREKRVQNTIMMAKAGGEPMQSAFSYKELEKLLEKHGFLIYELLTPDDIQKDIIDKAGADMKAFEHVNYCLAVRKDKNTNQLIGCCGLDCEKCDARIATITDDNSLREQTATLWTKLNGVTITPEMINCTGCRIEGVKTPFCDKLCPVHNCVRNNGLDTCADCPQMDGCPTLGSIAANSPFVLENLNQLREATEKGSLKDE